MKRSKHGDECEQVISPAPTVLPAPDGPAMPTRMGRPSASFFSSWMARIVRKNPLSNDSVSSMCEICCFYEEQREEEEQEEEEEMWRW
jgi:hypothetical protein